MMVEMDDFFEGCELSSLWPALAVPDLAVVCLLTDLLALIDFQGILFDDVGNLGQIAITQADCQKLMQDWGVKFPFIKMGTRLPNKW